MAKLLNEATEPQALHTSGERRCSFPDSLLFQGTYSLSSSSDPSTLTVPLTLQLFSKHTPKLFIGSIHAAFNLEKLKELGITHILNASGLPATFPRVFTYLSVDLRDKSHAHILGCIPATNIFIESGLEEGGGVLVHCAGGRSRSAAFIMAFLMSAHRLGFDDAERECKEARAVVDVNQGFQLQLQAYATAACDVHNAHQILLHKRLERFSERAFRIALRLRSTHASSPSTLPSYLSTVSSTRAFMDPDPAAASKGDCGDVDGTVASGGGGAGVGGIGQEEAAKEMVLRLLDQPHITISTQRPKLRLSRPSPLSSCGGGAGVCGAVQIIPPLRSLERTLACRRCHTPLFTYANVVRLDIDATGLDAEAWARRMVRRRYQSSAVEPFGQQQQQRQRQQLQGHRAQLKAEEESDCSDGYNGGDSGGVSQDYAMDTSCTPRHTRSPDVDMSYSLGPTTASMAKDDVFDGFGGYNYRGGSGNRHQHRSMLSMHTMEKCEDSNGGCGSEDGDGFKADSVYIHSLSMPSGLSSIGGSAGGVDNDGPCCLSDGEFDTTVTSAQEVLASACHNGSGNRIDFGITHAPPMTMRSRNSSSASVGSLGTSPFSFDDGFSCDGEGQALSVAQSDSRADHKAPSSSSFPRPPSPSAIHVMGAKSTTSPSVPTLNLKQRTFSCGDLVAFPGAYDNDSHPPGTEEDAKIMDGDAGGGDDGVSINAAVARINEQLSRSVVGGTVAGGEGLAEVVSWPAVRPLSGRSAASTASSAWSSPRSEPNSARSLSARRFRPQSAEKRRWLQRLKALESLSNRSCTSTSSKRAEYRAADGGNLAMGDESVAPGKQSAIPGATSSTKQAVHSATKVAEDDEETQRALHSQPLNATAFVGEEGLGGVTLGEYGSSPDGGIPSEFMADEVPEEKDSTRNKRPGGGEKAFFLEYLPWIGNEEADGGFWGSTAPIGCPSCKAEIGKRGWEIIRGGSGSGKQHLFQRPLFAVRRSTVYALAMPSEKASSRDSTPRERNGSGSGSGSGYSSENAGLAAAAAEMAD